MRLILATMFVLSFSTAQAATPAAWKALDTAARTACERDIKRIASRARVRATEGVVLGIGAERDEDRFYAVLLRGDTAGFASRWLCLYDKRARTAIAREVEAR
jgi:hypothetical protein